MNDALSRDEMMELVALYALGVLPREESALVAAFLANDDAARTEYLAMRGSADAIALTAAEPVDSARSARMKERLMARVRSDAAAGSVAQRTIGGRGWVWGGGLLTAAALLLAVITGVQVVTLQGRVAQSQARNSSLAAQLAQVERLQQHDKQMLTDLVSADARRYEVAQGSVVVRGDRLYFALSKLPALPRGKVYQAWTLPRGAKAVQPSVTFTPNRDGVAVVAIPVDAAKVGAVALSVEPEGGSKSPTTTPTFLRSLS